MAYAGAARPFPGLAAPAACQEIAPPASTLIVEPVR